MFSKRSGNGLHLDFILGSFFATLEKIIIVPSSSSLSVFHIFTLLDAPTSLKGSHSSAGYSVLMYLPTADYRLK